MKVVYGGCERDNASCIDSDREMMMGIGEELRSQLTLHRRVEDVRCYGIQRRLVARSENSDWDHGRGVWGESRYEL